MEHLSILSSTVDYLCVQCNNKLLYHLKLEELTSIPEDLIKFDATGDYKRPTPESIDDLFKEMEVEAKSGEGNGLDFPIYLRNSKTILHWAEKMGYEFGDDGLKKLEQTYRTNYLRKFQESLPERIKEILNKG